MGQHGKRDKIDRAQVTDKGRKLAEFLNPSIGTTARILRICSLICRLAPTYERLQVELCNGPEGRTDGWNQEAWHARIAKREGEIEARVKYLVGQLPTIDGKEILPVFNGDPRGATIKLRMPDGRGCDGGEFGLHPVPGA
jgi:hypothetical protein